MINVKDRGAVGDGVTDDTAAFLSARDAAKNVYVPEGIYIISVADILKNGFTLHGDGKTATILKQASGSNHDVVRGVGLQDVHIHDISLDGNKANNPSGDNGLSMVDPVNLCVERVSSYNNILKGFVEGGACVRSIYDKIEAYYNGQDGIAVASGTMASGQVCYAPTIINGFFHDNTLYGVGLDTPNNTYLRSDSASVINCLILNNGSYGIEVFGAKSPRIIGNHIEHSGNQGINLGSVSDAAFRVLGATVIGNTIKNGAHDGIRVQCADNCRIIGNRCFDDQSTKTQKYGIYYNAGSNNLIEGNDVNGNLIDGIFVGGTGGTYVNNPGYN